MKKVFFITDTWSEEKNLNGVVTWLRSLKEEFEIQGIQVIIIHPGLFFNVSLPTYPEIKISLFAQKKIKDMICAQRPDYIHIVTPGTLGLYAVRLCLKNRWIFSTFYHTRLPEYVSTRIRGFENLTYAYLRWFHNAGACTYVGTGSMRVLLEEKSFRNIVVLPLGINHAVFKKNIQAVLPDTLVKPVFVYLGRLAPEKNIEDFLECDLPGSKLVIGDGPSKSMLQKKYSTACFVGRKEKKEIVDLLSVSDVFVFPSRTDTFGLAIVEALACGLPVAAYDVAGPRDIITHGTDGFLGEDLKENALACLTLNQNDCIKKADMFSWRNTASQFLAHVAFLSV